MFSGKVATTTRATTRLAIRLVAAAAAMGIQVMPIETVNGAPLRIIRIINQAPDDLKMLILRTQSYSTGREVWHALPKGKNTTVNSVGNWETVLFSNTWGRCTGVHVFSGSDVTIRAPLPADLFMPETFMVYPLDDCDNEDATALTVVNKTPKPILRAVRDAVLAKPGAMVNFVAPVPLVLAPLTADKSSIVVTNETAVFFEVQVTSRSATRAGNWIIIAPGACDMWARPGQG
ncbi:hypothetical protein GGF31_005948 [Allomyces arbusculus]|nr:hypothetical protein GGF31_005948 [Allomyces arbusculus]